MQSAPVTSHPPTPNFSLPRLLLFLPLVLILLVSALVRIPLVTLEFGRNGDGTGSLYNIIARNYLVHDNHRTLWMPVISSHAPGSSEAPTLYAHHPPTVPLIVAASFALLGTTDVAARLPWLITTLAAVTALYLLLLRRLGLLAAVVGGGVLAFVPLSLRFGQMPDVINSLLVLACTLAIGAYLRLLDEPTSVRRLWILLAALLAAFLVDWPAFFLVPVIAVHLLVTRPARFVRTGLAVAAVSIAAFGGLYFWVSLATGDFHLIVRQFLNRVTQDQLDNQVAFSWHTWAVGVWAYNRTLHTIPLLIAGAAGLIVGVARPQSRPLLVMVGGWALVHCVVGRQGGLNHDWWWWPFTLFLATAAAALTAPLAKPAPRAVALGLTLAACLWWTTAELRHLRSREWIVNDNPFYSAKDLGLAARAAAPEGRAVMVFEWELQPYLAWYADRPLIQGVWTEADLRRRMTEGRADLFYSFDQSLGAPPTALVFPRAWEPKGQWILPYLKAHHPVTESGQFWIFDLTRRLGE